MALEFGSDAIQFVTGVSLVLLLATVSSVSECHLILWGVVNPFESITDAHHLFFAGMDSVALGATCSWC